MAKSHGLQLGLQTGHNPGTNGQAEPATPASTPTAPGTALEGTETNAGALAGIVSQLRDELAAQRQENAQLRKTIENLTALLAKMAGAGAGND